MTAERHLAGMGRGRELLPGPGGRATAARSRRGSSHCPWQPRATRGVETFFGSPGSDGNKLGSCAPGCLRGGLPPTPSPCSGSRTFSATKRSLIGKRNRAEAGKLEGALPPAEWGWVYWSSGKLCLLGGLLVPLLFRLPPPPPLPPPNFCIHIWTNPQQNVHPRVVHLPILPSVWSPLLAKVFVALRGPF